MATLSFPEDTVSNDVQCINISITDDEVFENDEYFLVHILSEQEVTTSSAFVNITDDDGM